LLTKRSSKLRSHAGEVSLPGGKRDEEDVDDTATALREANEEIGLHPGDAEVVAEIPPMLSKHSLSVKPIVATVPATFQPVPNADEVSDVFSMPLHAFLEAENHSHRDAVWGDVPYRLHFFRHEEFTVWGLTAAILINVAQLAFAEEAAFVVQDEGAVCVSKIHMRYGEPAVGSPPRIAGEGPQMLDD